MSDAEIEAAEEAEAERAAGLAEDWFEVTADEPPDLDPIRTNRMLKALAHEQHRRDEYDTAAKDELAELSARHDAERSELEDRITRGRQSMDDTIDHLTRRLELIGLARLAADPGAGSWTLPAGRLAVGGGGIEKEWGDAAALLAAAEKYAPEAIEPQDPKVNKAVLWAALKDAAVIVEHKRQVPANDDGSVIVNGEKVPGLVVRSKPRTITPTTIEDAF